MNKEVLEIIKEIMPLVQKQMISTYVMMRATEKFLSEKVEKDDINDFLVFIESRTIPETVNASACLQELYVEFKATQKLTERADNQTDITNLLEKAWTK